MVKLLNWFKDRILFIGVSILLIFIPLYPKFPLYEVPGTYVAIRFEDFLVAFLIGLLGLKIFFEKKNIFNDRLGRLIILYFFVGLVSSLSAILITKNVVSHLVLLHWLRRIEYMSLFFVAATSIRSIRDTKDYLIAIFLTTVGVAIYGLGQKFYGFPVVSTMNEEFSKGLLLSLTEWARVSSTFAGHYDLAAYLVLVLAVVAGSILSFTRTWQKIASLFLGLFAFYLLILTASQISIVAYMVGVTMVMVLSKKYLWLVPVLGLSILLTLASSDLSKRYATTLKVNLDFLTGIYQSRGGKIALLPPTPTPTIAEGLEATLTPAQLPTKGSKATTPTPTPTPQPKKYVYYGPTEPTEPTALTAYRSVKIRFDVEWPRAIRAFAKNPLLGTGYSSITLATDNDYLRALGETGLLGLVSLLLIMLEILRRFWVFLSQRVSSPERAIVIGIFGAIAGFLINAVFIDVFESSKVAFIFWILVGVMTGTINLSKTRLGVEK